VGALGRGRVRYADLILDESPASLPSGGSGRTRRWRRPPPTCGCSGATRRGQRCGAFPGPRPLPPPSGHARVGLAAASAISELVTLLPWVCAGCRYSGRGPRGRLAVRRSPGLLTPVPTTRRSRREAPERIAVPSGSHIAVLAYEPGRPPVLAVRPFRRSLDPRARRGSRAAAFEC
jgi:hypothetical protein